MLLESKFEHFIGFLKNEFFQKKVLILGFGKEGKSSYDLLTRYLPETNLFVADKNRDLKKLPSFMNNDHGNLFFGENYLSALKHADVILKSPGIKLNDGLITPLQNTTSQTDLFLRFYREQVIGVTGTKGKSTTASLIHHILINNKKESVLLGNIGTPCFDMVHKIEHDIVVFELSAHQLEFVTVSPRIAVLLNIFPEHLDYFNSYEEYQKAKENIFRFQSSNDILIAHESLADQTKKTNSKCIYFGSEKNETYTNQKIPLLGIHNFQNIRAAILTTRQLGISEEEAIHSLKNFKSLPHRLEYLGRKMEIDFYNDSISTIPESAIAAIKALERVDTIILGGFDRGLDYSKLTDFLKNSTISNFIFLGKAGAKMRTELDKSSARLLSVQNLEEAMPFIQKHTRPGFTCLLSPAASSYDQFHNFEHRGDTFKFLVSQLKNQ